jgi:hypothetical protein
VQEGAALGSIPGMRKVHLNVDVERDGMFARNLAGKFGIERRDEEPRRREPRILWVPRSPLIERVFR